MTQLDNVSVVKKANVYFDGGGATVSRSAGAGAAAIAVTD